MRADCIQLCWLQWLHTHHLPTLQGGCWASLSISGVLKGGGVRALKCLQMRQAPACIEWVHQEAQGRQSWSAQGFVSLHQPVIRVGLPEIFARVGVDYLCRLATNDRVCHVQTLIRHRHSYLRLRLLNDLLLECSQAGCLAEACVPDLSCSCCRARLRAQLDAETDVCGQVGWKIFVAPTFRWERAKTPAIWFLVL